MNIRFKEASESESTALHIAAKTQCYRSINLLLEKGMDVNAKDLLGFTPLDYAVTRKKWTAAKHLLDNGAINNHATRSANFTPLMIAGYARFKERLRKYPHGTSNPQALYTGYP